MKVSIIIPVYNVAPYIKRCLDSVVAQTYTDIECILIDDCGTDNGMKIAVQFIKDYHGHVRFFIIHHPHNRGLSAARNTGIDVATGKYVFFLDSDDAITPDCIEILAGLLVKHPDADIVHGNTIAEGEGLIQQSFKQKVPEYSEERITLDKLLLNNNVTTAWNILINRSFLLNNQLFFREGIVHEDVYWKFFLSLKIRSAAFTNTGTYYYFKNNDSIMHSTSGQMGLKRINGYRTCIKSFYEEIRRKGSTSTHQRQYTAIVVLYYSRHLVAYHSIIQWFSFWMLILRSSVQSIRKATIPRVLFFLAMMPPFCFLSNCRSWYWRLCHYVISKI